MLHMRKLRKLSGQTAVPVIESSSEGVIAGSAAIVAHLESINHSRSLIPSDPEQKKAALEWQATLDTVGGKVRGAMFYDFLEDKSYFHKMLTANREFGVGYKLIFILMSPVLRKKLTAVEPNPDVFRQQVSAALDSVAEGAKATGYLVGNQFTIADLTAAALFFPLCFPAGTPAHDAARSAKAGEIWLDRWSGHPALEYIRRMYQLHRTPE